MKPTKTTSTKNYAYKMMKTPIGNLKLVGGDQGLATVLWEKKKPSQAIRNIADEDKGHPVLAKAEKQLSEYFLGRRKKFDLKLDFNGTEFQKKVWKALLDIPFGETRSYGQIARQIGKPTAARAVGAANGRNPISIIAACHRVIGSSGKLTGYAGGMETKAHLIKLEGGELSGKAHKNSRVLR